jgi:hypothetical protein
MEATRLLPMNVSPGVSLVSPAPQRRHHDSEFDDEEEGKEDPDQHAVVPFFAGLVIALPILLAIIAFGSDSDPYFQGNLFTSCALRTGSSHCTLSGCAWCLNTSQCVSYDCGSQAAYQCSNFTVPTFCASSASNIWTGSILASVGVIGLILFMVWYWKHLRPQRAFAFFFGFSFLLWIYPARFIIPDPSVDSTDTFTFVFVGVLVFAEGKQSFQAHFNLQHRNLLELTANVLRGLALLFSLVVMAVVVFLLGSASEAVNFTFAVSLITLSVALLQTLELDQHRYFDLFLPLEYHG